MLEKNGIHIQYIPKNQIVEVFSALKQLHATPLVLLNHSQQSPLFTVPETANPIQAAINLQSGLECIDDDYCELWSATGEWKQGRWAPDKCAGTTDVDSDDNPAITYCCNQEYLLGSLSIELPDVSSLQELSQHYYEQIIRFIGTQGKPHLLRMWNYFPHINRLDNNLERYQQFCIGRHLAFAEAKKPCTNEKISLNHQIQYPAASAVGSHSSSMAILFIATQRTGQFIENPDQVSAYDYPEVYSPKSPSFARASVYQSPVSNQLYISGTASIVGHESKFHGDIIGQTQQTIKNLKKLIQHTNHQKGIQKPFSFAADLNDEMPAIKVYLRKPEDLTLVSPLIEDFVPNGKNICYLQADICRQELDIEIEMFINS